MGTDIHFFVEQRANASTEWETVGAEGSFYDGARSVPLFAMLGDVRISSNWNYAGYEPIAPPRDLPADASQEVRHYMQMDDVFGLHNASWFTLTELLATDWPMELQEFKDGTLHQIGLLATGTGRTTDDVRIVFAFDN